MYISGTRQRHPRIPKAYSGKQLLVNFLVSLYSRWRSLFILVSFWTLFLCMFTCEWLRGVMFTVRSLYDALCTALWWCSLFCVLYCIAMMFIVQHCDDVLCSVYCIALWMMSCVHLLVLLMIFCVSGTSTAVLCILSCVYLVLVQPFYVSCPVCIWY